MTENQSASFTALVTKLADVDLTQFQGTEEYCKIEPGVVDIVQGIQQIVSQFVSGAAKFGIDIAFTTLIAALKAPCGS